MTDLRKQISNIVEDHQECLVLAKSVGSSEVYEGTTATEEDIILGKTAYSNGKLIEGKLELLSPPRLPDITNAKVIVNKYEIHWDNVAKDDPNALCYIVDSGIPSIVNIPQTDSVKYYHNGENTEIFTYKIKTISDNPDYLNSNEIILKRGRVGFFKGTNPDSILPTNSYFMGFNNFNDVTFTKGVNIIAGNTINTFGFKNQVGYATTMYSMIMRPQSSFDSKRLYVHKNVLSTGTPISFAIWCGFAPANSGLYFSGELTLDPRNERYYGKEWITNVEYIGLPSYLLSSYRVLVVAVKCGDGSRDFTDEELEELKTCFEIKTSW